MATVVYNRQLRFGKHNFRAKKRLLQFGLNFPAENSAVIADTLLAPVIVFHLPILKDIWSKSQHYFFLFLFHIS